MHVALRPRRLVGCLPAAAARQRWWAALWLAFLGLTFLGLALASTDAAAQRPAEPAPGPKATTFAAERASAPTGDPLWELGVFGVAVTQQAYPGSDQQVQRALVLPFGIYRGRFLRADQDTAGLRAIRTDRFEVDVGFAGSFGASSNEIEARRGMPDLGTLVEFGPRLKWRLDAGGDDASALPRRAARWSLELPLRGVFDLNDRGANRGVSLEPELAFSHRVPGGWNLNAGVGAIFGDQRLTRTLYGVDAAFAQPGRPAYEARAGLVAWRASASFSRPLTTDWRAFGFARLDSVAGAANAESPLVRRTGGVSAGFGVAYTWMRSGERAAD